MNIDVEHIDVHGNLHNRNDYISRLAFVKHMAFVGQGPHSPFINPGQLMRVLGMFLHYYYYLNRRDFNNNRFSLPPRILSDPTEQSQFSNIAGRAIADFLSKLIDNSFFTFNYEALAPRPLHGARPDLIAFSRTSVFVLESKGRMEPNPGNMAAHKTQASSGVYPRNFSIASVSYNLYNRVKCNYHDPYNESITYDADGLRRMSQLFYMNLFEFVNEKYFRIETLEYRGESFFAIEILPLIIPSPIKGDMPFHFFHYDLIERLRPRLILPSKIEQLAKNGLNRETKPFEQLQAGENIYIDADRVGLQIRW